MSDKMLMLKQKISDANMTQDALAVKIGMNPSTFYRKVKIGVDAFTVGEMHSLVDALRLTENEATQIFLS
ncbi:helix-turn-helix transcriptional regulator [uncultured Gemmiger sp.]|uniref:helix-turn-helix domain-containing protein n=1 Tax=uncultured Gemmiger sp. TaxID=1623490 RepID=UPI002666251C|nr:helix-turn-helix transcriptional regulator [uncultured Gemmiger sp.]